MDLVGTKQKTDYYTNSSFASFEHTKLSLQRDRDSDRRERGNHTFFAARWSGFENMAFAVRDDIEGSSKRKWLYEWVLLALELHETGECKFDIRSFGERKARLHVARYALRIFEEFPVRLLVRPPRFSDLPPIEYVWDIIG
ncbi:hypothetical protein Trydic_g484 [Trypoxylus dichotomus]